MVISLLCILREDIPNVGGFTSVGVVFEKVESFTQNRSRAAVALVAVVRRDSFGLSRRLQ